MTIASPQIELLGIKTFIPEGPFDFVTTFPSQRLGVCVEGDYESEYVPLYFDATAGQTVKQGDALVWDGTYTAIYCITANATRGMSFGTLYLGGRYGDATAGGGAIGGGAAFSYTFPVAGRYMIYAQRAGTSLLSVNSSAATGNLAETTTTSGQVGAPASPTVTSKLIAGLYLPAAQSTFTFTANTTNGSAVLTNVSLFKGLAVGQTISGTGIPTGTIITLISAGSITISNAATATNTSTTITVTNYQFYCTTTNGSPTLTNVTTVYGIYPGATLTGTGVSGTVVSINGSSGNWSITMSANASASGSNIAVAATLYTEALLKWPYIDKTN